MITSSESGQVATKDLFHVSYLLACGMEITDIILDEASHREKATFVLTGHDIELYERQYRNREATVNLFQLKEAMKHAKDMMFDFIRTRQGLDNTKRSERNELYQRANQRH